MEKITDKELLTICNLSNLKMEFAKYVNFANSIFKLTYFDTRKNIYTNHTIYLLIENELNGQKTRDSIREKYEKI